MDTHASRDRPHQIALKALQLAFDFARAEAALLRGIRVEPRARKRRWPGPRRMFHASGAPKLQDGT